MISRPDNPELTVVVPCYNEADVLPLLVEALEKFAENLSSIVKFLLIDDGSTDETLSLIKQTCREDDRFACISFSRNFGHQKAVSAGLRHAQGDVIAVIDADLQDPPEVIPRMIEKWKQGADVVYGIRERRKEGAFLRIAYAVYYRLLKYFANIEIPLDAGDFSLMDRRVVDHMNRMPERNRFVRGLRGWVGFKQVGLPYERKGRLAGHPKYNVRRLFDLAIDGIVSFSSVPLRAAIWIGLLTAFGGFVLFLWVLISTLFLKETPSGWASLAVMVLVFGGIQLIVLGIVGEYIGRIFEEVKHRPPYIIAHSSGWVRPIDQQQEDARQV